jgi:hypothetical protein
MFGFRFDHSNTDASQVALKNDIEYATVLGMLREARSQGLKAPVLLMGMLYPSLYIPFRLTVVSTRVL